MKGNDENKCSGFQPRWYIRTLEEALNITTEPTHPSAITAESFQGEPDIRFHQKFSKVNPCEKFQVKEVAEMFPESCVWISTTDATV